MQIFRWRRRILSASCRLTYGSLFAANTRLSFSKSLIMSLRRAASFTLGASARVVSFRLLACLGPQRVLSFILFWIDQMICLTQQRTRAHKYLALRGTLVIVRFVAYHQKNYWPDRSCPQLLRVKGAAGKKQDCTLREESGLRRKDGQKNRLR